MARDKLLYTWEKEAVQLRHYEGLCRLEIAERLKLRPAQVKYIFSKPNVKRHIQQEVLPDLWRKQIAEIEQRLKDPIKAYVQKLIANKNAMTPIWVGPGKKRYIPAERKRLGAIFKALRMFGVTDPMHCERNVKRDVLKHKAMLQERLDLLKEQLLQVEKTKNFA
ncbi:MAG TPA: hypothetical protein VMW16_09475 [Sedimentisphaerales bacterium]|nr:hypothetical protein [Sedimentisphaerales bacterium]